MTIRKAAILLIMLFCVAFVTGLMVLRELKLTIAAVILSSFVVSDLIKNWNK